MHHLCRLTSLRSYFSQICRATFNQMRNVLSKKITDVKHKKRVPRDHECSDRVDVDTQCCWASPCIIQCSLGMHARSPIALQRALALHPSTNLGDFSLRHRTSSSYKPLSRRDHIFAFIRDTLTEMYLTFKYVDLTRWHLKRQ